MTRIAKPVLPISSVPGIIDNTPEEWNEESWNLLYLLFFSSILLLLLLPLGMERKLCRLCRGFIPAFRNDPITVTHISFPPRSPLSREFDCFPRHSSFRYSIRSSVQTTREKKKIHPSKVVKFLSLFFFLNHVSKIWNLNGEKNQKWNKTSVEWLLVGGFCRLYGTNEAYLQREIGTCVMAGLRIVYSWAGLSGNTEREREFAE